VPLYDKTETDGYRKIGWVWNQKAYLVDNMIEGWVAFVKDQTPENIDVWWCDCCGMVTKNCLRVEQSKPNSRRTTMGDELHDNLKQIEQRSEAIGQQWLELIDHIYNTTPPQRKPLTDEEIGAILEGVNAYGTRLYTFARAIEAAHGIKGEA